MGYVIVALCVVIAWQHARYRRVQADSVLLAGKIESLTERVDYLDMVAYENACMADEYADALLQRSYICNGCGHVIPDSVPATQRVEVGGKMAGKVTYRCADCVREDELNREGGYCPTGDGSDGDDSDDTLQELAFAECAICESTVTVMPETHGPALCCYCRADFREETDGLPLPSDSEVDRLLADARSLADDTLGTMN